MIKFTALLASAFALLIALAGAARADQVVFATDRLGTFGKLDLTTGVFTKVSAVPALSGLGMIGNTLYGAGLYTNVLYQIDVADGTAAEVGTGIIAIAAFGSTMTGLYGLDNGGNLWSVDAATGKATYIGQTNLPVASSCENWLSSGSSTLYASEGTGNGLYAIDTTTGVATEIGVGNAGALVLQNGTLYAAGGCPDNAVNIIDPETGGATFVADLSGNFRGATLAGLAPSPSQQTVFGITAQVVDIALSGTTLTLNLQLTNGNARTVSNLRINSIALSPAADATLSAPTLPYTVGNIAPGTAATVPMSITITSGLPQLQMIESGTFSTNVNFKFSQKITP
ncbi:MAG TPA: hypothetical protein VFB15_08560 [Candidatus Binataceae bacterium]|nr:hypothetical protein [Candidatus Binataceae bacterium]